MADDDASADDLPISWDEAREVVIVVATVAATVMLLGPVVGFFGDRYSGFSLSDDIAEVTRNAGPSTGVLVLVAASMLPGCAVSLFSSAKKNPQSEAEVRHMEMRMDQVEAELAKRRSAEQ